MKKWIFGVIAVAAAIQLIRPTLTHAQADIKESLNADENVMKILKTSCYDCHSDETKFPWYSHVAPVSWFIADHVNEGREALNFSHWVQIDDKTKAVRLKRAKQLVSNELMPIHGYLMMHKEAKLTENQKEVLESFFNQELHKINQ